MSVEDLQAEAISRVKALLGRVRRLAGARMPDGGARRALIDESYGGNPDDFVQRAYLAVLGRPADPIGRRRLVAELEERKVTPRQAIDSLVASAEFARRLSGALTGGAGGRPLVTPPPDYLDPKTVVETQGMEKLMGTAESYFSSMPDPSHLFAKPFASIEEAPEILVSLGQLLACFKPLPGQVVLDFGAGSCWTSRSLAQLGAEVIACDASETALQFGRQLFDRFPVAGEKPTPRFLHFDGYKLELDEESVDAVCCFDAFHHIPNPEDVLSEFFRVLRPGGLAAFSEVGEHHSHTTVAQREMRSWGVLENDIVLAELWPAMERIGFESLQVNVFSTASCLLPLASFEDFMDGGGAATNAYLETTRRSLDDRRMFVIRKPGQLPVDSRQTDGLDGTLSLRSAEIRREGGSWKISGTLDVENTGVAVWRPSGVRVGDVSVGLRIPGAALVDVGRIPISEVDPTPPRAKRELRFDVSLEASLFEGSTELELALVSDGVTWFGPVVIVRLKD